MTLYLQPILCADALAPDVTLNWRQDMSGLGVWNLILRIYICIIVILYYYYIFKSYDFECVRYPEQGGRDRLRRPFTYNRFFVPMLSHLISRRIGVSLGCFTPTPHDDSTHRHLISYMKNDPITGRKIAWEVYLQTIG